MKILRSPALHFLIIGGLLFAVAAQQQSDSPLHERPQLIISKSRFELARNQFLQAAGRPPTAEDEQRMLDTLVDQEILYQYALRLGLYKQPVAERRLAQIAAFVEENPHEPPNKQAQTAIRLGLHHGDVVVRRILIDGARRVIRAVALIRRPQEEMLEDYLRNNPEQFLTPARTRITQVAVNRFKYGAATEARARELADKLRSGSYSPKDAASLGDTVFSPASLPLLTQQDFVRRFGYSFAQSVNALPEKTWSEPIASRHGLHIVYVQERMQPQVPPLRDIRKKVRRSLLSKLADEWLTLRLQQLRAEFEIVLPERA